MRFRTALTVAIAAYTFALPLDTSWDSHRNSHWGPQAAAELPRQVTVIEGVPSIGWPTACPCC